MAEEYEPVAINMSRS